MTDKEIIAFWDDIARAIETGEKSGAKVTGVRMTAEQAEATYNLIKRLKRENNSYRNKAQVQKGELRRLYKQNAEYEEKIEAVKDYLHPLPFETVFDKRIEREKTDAIKEFAERLKKVYENHLVCSFNVLNNEIDNLVKEMVGDTK